jgi:hemoglobin/transferrin/lactoferrin receptor protein
MKFIFAVVIFFICHSASLAQDSTTQKDLEGIIIYSNKFAERKKNLAQKIDVIAEKQISLLNSQNTGDLLINTGNVFVQKSQQGGSSPVIRGFEASRVLLVVDGIRMNNAIYRSGHLQNVITVDQNMLERIEVLYGPASTLYGSDALGGVVHMRTKQPKLSETGNLHWLPDLLWQGIVQPIMKKHFMPMRQLVVKNYPGCNHTILVILMT